MPPQRIRNVIDESRYENSGAREKQLVLGISGGSKARRYASSCILPGSNLKDVTNAHSDARHQGTQDAATNVITLPTVATLKGPLILIVLD